MLPKAGDGGFLRLIVKEQSRLGWLQCKFFYVAWSSDICKFFYFLGRARAEGEGLVVKIQEIDNNTKTNCSYKIM